MKIGLLECDHVLPELRFIGGDYRDMFPALFPGLEFANFDVCNGQFPASTGDCDAWLCTGSRHSVYDETAWLAELKNFVRELHDRQRKFIGVCFGHQLLGEALGGKVQKGAAGWCVGVHTFELTATEDWMEPFQGHYNLLMSCQDQVVQLPDNSVVLATSAACPVGMFRVGEHMLGIQAHPEFPVKYAEALMDMRVERIGAEKVRAGKASLGFSIHQNTVVGWMRRFLEK